MSAFNVPIAPSVRRAMSLLPPPPYTAEAEQMTYGPELITLYADRRRMKQMHKVYVEEVADYQPEKITYSLYVVGMPIDADMSVIMNAARHLSMCEAFEISRGYKSGLSKGLERSYIEVKYPCAVTVYAADEVQYSIPVILSAERRRAIWMGLFEAAGYNVEWGRTVNVRKQ